MLPTMSETILSGQVKLTTSSAHARQHWVRRACLRIARFLTSLRSSAEQLQRWYRILSEALRQFLQGRQLAPPRRLNPT